MDNCILCESTEIKVIEKISSSELIEIYEQKGVPVKQFFKENSLNLCQCCACGLQYFSPETVGDGQFYANLQQKIDGYYLKEKEDYVIAAKYIEANENVLEIGCGEGFFTNYLPTKNYTGLEFNDAAIAEAQRKNLNVLKDSIENFAEKNVEKFDVVCYFQVLEHIPQPHSFIKNSLKCLKKGGKLIFAVPSEETFLRFGVNLFLNAPPHHVSRWIDDVFRKMEKIFGIKLQSIVHEKLHDIHKVFYLQCQIQHKLRRILGIPYQNFEKNNSSTYRLFKFSYLLSKIFSPIYFLFKKEAIGQSVIVVYTKN